MFCCQYSFCTKQNKNTTFLSNSRLGFAVDKNSTLQIVKLLWAFRYHLTIPMRSISISISAHPTFSSLWQLRVYVLGMHKQLQLFPFVFVWQRPDTPAFLTWPHHAQHVKKEQIEVPWSLTSNGVNRNKSFAGQTGKISRAANGHHFWLCGLTTLYYSFVAYVCVVMMMMHVRFWWFCAMSDIRRRVLSISVHVTEGAQRFAKLSYDAHLLRRPS